MFFDWFSALHVHAESMPIRSVSVYFITVLLVALQSRRRFVSDCIAAIITRIIISAKRLVLVVVVVLRGTLPAMTTPSTIFCLSCHVRRWRHRHHVVIVMRLRHKSLLRQVDDQIAAVNTFGPLASTAVGQKCR